MRCFFLSPFCDGFINFTYQFNGTGAHILLDSNDMALNYALESSLFGLCVCGGGE